MVIAPTRELAGQIKDQARKFASNSSLSRTCVVLYGGTSVHHQKQTCQKGVNILIATPGRLNQFIEEGIISLKKVPIPE